MTAKDLKNALLQEAIQGKLTEGWRNKMLSHAELVSASPEYNAKALLEQIKKERGESLPLAAERKRSSATPSAGSNAARNACSSHSELSNRHPELVSGSIPEDEIPFDIPESWCWCKIGEIFNLQAGKTISASDISETSNGNDYLCYGGNGIRGYVKNYNRDGYFPLIGRQGALCGNINFAKGKFYATEHAVVVETFANTNIDWAGVFLKALNLNQYATATAQPGLAVRNINEVYIPLPPLAEQKRIVEAIEKFMPLIEEYGKKEAVLKELNANIGTLTKKAILQEAVQGKLVPQIPAEGNAKDLLEQIKAQKAKLIKEGKIKKEKPLPEIYDSNGVILSEVEVPFDIPENWCWCRLGEVLTIARGGSPRPIQEYLTTDDNSYNWIKIGDTDKDGKYINSTKERIKKEGLHKTRLVRKGDLLLTNSMSFGRPYILNVDGCIHDGWLVFSDYQDIFNKDYLYYILSSNYAYNQFSGVVAGAVVKNLNSDKVASALFPLPPLAEQKRIVTAIEQLLPLCEKLGK